MEKRLVLSFVLSFLVLYVWAALAPKKPIPPLPNPTQENSTTEDMPVKTMDPEIAAVNNKAESAAVGEVYVLENDKLLLEFSTFGGSLTHVVLKEYGEELPVDHIGGFEQFSKKVFGISRNEGNFLEFTHIGDGLAITRRYEINDASYTLKVVDSVKNTREMSNDIRLDIIGFTLNMDESAGGHISEEDSQSGPGANRDRGLNEYAISSEQGIKRKNNAYKFSAKEDFSVESPVKWLAFRNRYYAAIVRPDFETRGYTTKVLTEKVFQIRLDSHDLQLSPGQQVDYEYTAFVGPEKTEILKEYESNFEDIKRYYKLGIFDGIAKIIAAIMALLYKFIHNWGACIILISIIIYYSMYPLTAKGMASMKRMQSLQPKIQKLKERYEDNPQKLNQEMLELYRKEKINPLGGCLPMLLQMPVFIGLYQVLWRNVDFKGAHFLWIKDLSQPDRLFVMNISLPVIGNDINLLPILMMIIMFLQQKFSAKNMTVTDPMQLQQQKMMGTVMPLLLGFIFYKFASGLTLYFTMFYIFSTVTQWKISKEPKVATA